MGIPVVNTTTVCPPAVLLTWTAPGIEEDHDCTSPIMRSRTSHHLVSIRPAPQSSSSVPCCTAAAVAVPLPSHPRLEQSDRTASSRRLRTVLFACETRRTERDFSFPSLASRTVSRLACTARHYSKLIFWCVGSSKPAGTPVQTQTISANQGWTRVLL